MVYGFGEQKTPQSFVSACDKFVYTEVLRSKESVEGSMVKKMSTSKLKMDTKLVSLFRNAIEAASDDSGWAHLGDVGNNIAKQASEFDPRNYGYNKLGELAAAIKLFEIDKRNLGEGHTKVIYIRDKRKNN